VLVKDLMSKPVVWCTPWDTAQTAARLMKSSDIGALVVVADTSDPLLEGIVTDRDLCRGVAASKRDPQGIIVADVMTPIPLTCMPEDTIDDCIALMQHSQVRRMPVVNDRGRCVGILALGDIVLHVSTRQAAETIREISSLRKPHEQIQFDKDFFYCGQPHEMDQILLLNRRHELARNSEVLT